MRLINADEFMKAVEEAFDGVCVYDVPPSEAISDIERIVDSMPTIDAEPVRHGRWIPIYEEVERLTTEGWVMEEAQTAWKCSECGREELIECGTMPYCHCGAKMDLEVEHD